MSKLPDGNSVIDIDFFTKVPSPPADAGMPKRKTSTIVVQFLDDVMAKIPFAILRHSWGGTWPFFVVLWKDLLISNRSESRSRLEEPYQIQR